MNGSVVVNSCVCVRVCLQALECNVFTRLFTARLAERDPGNVPFAPSHYAFVSHAPYEKKGVLVPCVLQVL